MQLAAHALADTAHCKESMNGRKDQEETRGIFRDLKTKKKLLSITFKNETGKHEIF